MPVSCPSPLPLPWQVPVYFTSRIGLCGPFSQPGSRKQAASSLSRSSGLLRVVAWLRALFLFPARVHMLHAHSAVTHSSPWEPSPLAPLDPPLTPRRLAGSLQPRGPLGAQDPLGRTASDRDPRSSFLASPCPGRRSHLRTPARTHVCTRICQWHRGHTMCAALPRAHRAPSIPCCTRNQHTAAVGRGPRGP